MSEQIIELVTAIVDGDIHRFAEVVQRYDSNVRRLIGSRLPNADSATREDLVQEAFYRAFKNLPRLKDPAQLENWLVKIAINCTNDHLRRVDRQRKQHRLLTEAQPGFQDDLDNDQGWVWEEIRQMRRDHAQILLLRYQLNLSYAEIATRLQIPESTVRGRIYAARHALRRRLNDKGLSPE